MTNVPVGTRVRIVSDEDLPPWAKQPHPEHNGKFGRIVDYVETLGVASPEILLDSGETIYGYQCWWESLDD